MTYCTNCGKETSARKICEHCGVKKNKKHNFCEWCGTAFEPNTKVCPNCKEPKRIGSIIGNAFRLLFAIIIIFVGFVYTMSGLLSLPEGLLPGLIVLLIGIAILPSSQRILYKITHNNLQYRKTIRLVATPVLIIVLFFSMNSWTTIYGYSKAMEHWEDNAYAAAMDYLVRHPEYKDSQEYIDKFETEVYTSLMETPWCSDLMKYGNYADRWDYEFHSDGTLLRRKQLWKENVYVTGSGYELDSYEDTVFSGYSLAYGSNDETGVYEVCIQFGYDFEYVLNLGIAEDGTIVVIGFYGTVGTQGDSWYSRDSHLPE